MQEKKILHMVSHTHWDREWYFSFERFQYRFVKMMDRLLDILEGDPTFKSFTMDGQILVIKDYLEVRPENRGRIERLIAEGRLLVGPWYAQPNVFMVEGESLIRNLLLGMAESEALGGVMKLNYLPDVFGQASQMPQIARGFGMEETVFCRGVPEGADTVFEWEGADGSRLLVANTIGGYHLAYDLPIHEGDYTEYVDGQAVPRQGLKQRVTELAAQLSEKSRGPHLLFMNGVDHAFAQKNIPQVMEQINDTLPGMEAVHDTLPGYFAAVRAYHQAHNLDFMQAKGEMRHTQGWILQGSQTTRSDVKMTSSHIESLFTRWMEPFASYAWVVGAAYPQAIIGRAWEYLLQNHAHDSMACSSAENTYHQVMTRFEWAQEIGEEVVDESLMILANRIDCPGVGEPGRALLTVFNPLGWQRSEVVTARIDVPHAAGIHNPGLFDGETFIPMSIHGQHSAKAIRYTTHGTPYFIDVERYTLSFRAQDIPAVGYKAYTLRNLPVPHCNMGSMVTAQGTMENAFLKVTLQRDGTFDLLDKRTGRLFQQLHFFEDSGEAGEGFSRLAPQQDRIFYSLGGSARISLEEDTPLRATYRVELTLMLPTALTQDRRGRSEEMVPCDISSLITLYAEAPRVDIETRVTNRAKDHRLRVVFPSDIQGAVSFAESPFDVVERGIELPDFNNYPGEKPSPTHPQLSFAGISDGKEGLSIANQGLFEYEVMDNDRRSVAITLLRCLDRIIGGPIYTCEELLIPEAQCLGSYTFRYSVVPHPGGWQQGYAMTQAFRHPLKALVRRDLEEQTLGDFDWDSISKVLPVMGSLVASESGELVITAVKKHETRNSLVIRAWNRSGETIATALTVNADWVRPRAVYAVNLREERGEKMAIDGAGRIDLTLRGKGLITLELELASMS